MYDPTPSAPIGRDPISALVAWMFSRGGFVALCVGAAGVGMVGMANNDHYQGHHTAMLACAVLAGSALIAAALVLRGGPPSGPPA